MKVLVSIPLNLHSDLLGRYETKSPRIYALLKNAIVENEGDSPRVKILCSPETAAKFAAFIDSCIPGAADQIEVAPDPSN